MCWAAILALIPARIITEVFADFAPRRAAYVAAFLFLTSRRSGIWRSTLAIGTGAGVAFGGSVPPAGTRIGQGIAAGVLANLTGALLVTAAGTSTTALMLGSASVRQWVYHGQHLSTLAFYHREQIASVSTEVYVLMCIIFPVIGLIVSIVAAVVTNPVPRQLDPGPPGPGLAGAAQGR